MSAASDFTLFGYFRSSAAFRVRIALNLKNLQTDLRFVHLLKEGGQQHKGAYKAVNSQELIPQITNARRIQMDLSPYPTLRRIEETAYHLPAFTAARPENQPDAE